MERVVILITGPTCSGKTSLSLKLAELLNTEIISADSRQVYKYLDIGTAKPLAEELNTVKHHLVDFLYPDEEYNASRFEDDALRIISNLFREDRIPIVTGGSGLYVKALVDGIFNSVDTDEVYREELKLKISQSGYESIYEELKQVDPISASRMLPQNYKRVMRALEVFHLTGKPIWQHHQEFERGLNIKFVQYALNWQRDKLYNMIEARVDKMIDLGLVEETKNVFNASYNKSLNSLNTVGYKEIISFLEGEMPLEGAVELIKRNTRRFAKRQLTWFRKDERIKWLDISSPEEIQKHAADISKDFLK